MCVGALQILGDHLVDHLGGNLDSRASFKELCADIYKCHLCSREAKAQMPPRLRDEIQALVACPATSQAEATCIEGILLRRFFRGPVRSSYNRPNSTRGATQQVENPSSNKVINIPELLEAILSHLPSRSLIRSTGVSKTFRNLTLSSPTLRRNLFLLERKPSETLSMTSYGKGDPGEPYEQTKEYKIATLCPLLHMDRRSHLTIEEIFESHTCEVAAIDPRAAHADSFTQMYLTNPPCVEVDVMLVYKGTAPSFEYTYPSGEMSPVTDCTISAGRTIREKTGVTFAMLMEVTHTKNFVWIAEEEQIDQTCAERTLEEDEEASDEDYDSRTRQYTLYDSTLHDQIRAWERRHRSSMRLDLAATEVTLHGVVIRTAADFAALEKADRDAKMEEEQRELFHTVLRELKQKAAERAGGSCETLDVIEEC